ncbi:unnamed protein product [Plutella xylostella]|uniref:(diamondback moth) hypothetical protein n=1 Tax=Plutella xylostella TaxID=51655 RepID=A0A8S4GBS3_PLUXY|nr:unnamed protein product [Plutella xylostella]
MPPLVWRTHASTSIGITPRNGRDGLIRLTWTTGSASSANSIAQSSEALRGRRCASLRSSGAPPRPAEDSGRSTPAAPVSPSPASTPAPKKSNWEVIEHFSSSRSRRSPTSGAQGSHRRTSAIIN